MDRDHLGSLLFLSSLVTSAAACAGGTGSPAPRPNSFGTAGNDDGGASGETWTDPLQTSGSPDSDDSDDSDDSKGWGSTGDWPNEGETGSPTNGGSSGPDTSPDDSGATGMGSTSDASGDSSGGYDEGSTGYDPPVGGDPCPALAQLYSDCVADYTYESEIDLCQEARANAQAISFGCGVAHSEYLACLSTLDCVTLLEPGVPFPCLIQSAATDIACSP